MQTSPSSFKVKILGPRVEGRGSKIDGIGFRHTGRTHASISPGKPVHNP
jgi:hypothetical protein